MSTHRVLQLIFTLLFLFATTVAFCQTTNFATAKGKWKVYKYNPSHTPTLSSKVSTATETEVTFDFTATPDTAYFLTSPEVSDFTGKTLTATFHVSPAATNFINYGGSSPCGTPPSLRFYFETKATGPFEATTYWWADISFVTLASLTSADTTITVPIDPANFSDWDGHPALFNAFHTAAFNAAAANVTNIGLSFGGNCGFANGVGTPDALTTFHLTNYSF